jgi:hypothetical protein
MPNTLMGWKLLMVFGCVEKVTLLVWKTLWKLLLLNLGIKKTQCEQNKIGISTLIGVGVNKLYMISNQGKKTLQVHICYYFHLANSRPIKSTTTYRFLKWRSSMHKVVCYVHFGAKMKMQRPRKASLV